MTLGAAIRAVLAGTAAAGVAGGVLGAGLARLAPGFFEGSGSGDALENGLALGAIGGLVLGAAWCVLLAAVKMWADARNGAGREGP